MFPLTCSADKPHLSSEILPCIDVKTTASVKVYFVSKSKHISTPRHFSNQAVPLPHRGADVLVGCDSFVVEGSRSDQLDIF